MGKCKYCGNGAGLFHDKHAECEEQHQQRERAVQARRQQIIGAAMHALNGSGDFNELETKLGEIEEFSIIPFADRKTLLIEAWENSVEQFLNDGVLDPIEEKRLVQFKERFALSQSELDVNGTLTRTAKAAVLRDILNGIIPQRMSIQFSKR